MSYYLGQSDIPVKPVTRRMTFTRGSCPQRTPRYLQKAGRRPLNRIGYPTMGTPIALDLSREPGQGTLGHSVNDPILLSVRTRAGRRFVTRVYDPFSSVGPEQLGLSFNVPALTTAFRPSVPSVVAAPAPESSSFWGLPAAVVNLWNSRPQVVKNIKIRINPVKTAQQFLSPKQVQDAVDYARKMGLDPSYQGVPITGEEARYGYQFAGIDWMKYAPWLIGGGALLFVVPMLMKKR